LTQCFDGQFLLFFYWLPSDIVFHSDFHCVVSTPNPTLFCFDNRRITVGTLKIWESPTLCNSKCCGSLTLNSFRCIGWKHMIEISQINLCEDRVVVIGFFYFFISISHVFTFLRRMEFLKFGLQSAKVRLDPVPPRNS
jgi:hypothetical protein